MFAGKRQDKPDEPEGGTTDKEAEHKNCTVPEEKYSKNNDIPCCMLVKQKTASCSKETIAILKEKALTCARNYKAKASVVICEV